MSEVHAAPTGPGRTAVTRSLPVQRSVGALAPGDFPVLLPVLDEHVRMAVRAVVTHASQEWPAGAVCRNDRQPYPCRLARWGRRVLIAAGAPDDRIDDLVAAGDPYAWPLA